MNDDIKDKDAKYISEVIKKTFDYVRANHEFKNFYEARIIVMTILEHALLLNGVTMKLSFDEVKEALNETIEAQKATYENIYNQIINKK